MSKLSRKFRELIQLRPRTTGAPSDIEEGDIFIDGSTNPFTLKYRDNTGTVTVATLGNVVTSSVTPPITNNAIVRFDGTGGQIIQDSPVIIADNGDVTGVADLTATNVAGTITTAVQAQINHDSLLNFVAGEHILHSGVTLTAGAGMSGGGTIAANRTFNVDITNADDKASPVAADELLIADSADSNNIKKADVASFLDALNGDVTATLLTTQALADNQSAAADVFTLTAASNTGVVVEYSITRGSGNSEVGQLYLVNDETNADVAGTAANMGTLGVVFSADIDSGNVRLRYTTTSTGTAASMKYSLRRWTA